MNHPLRGKAAIVGFGDSYAHYGEAKTVHRLAMEAIKAALQDSGLEKDDIDGFLTGRSPQSENHQPQWNNILAAYCKITPQYASEITIHAAGMNSMIKHAAMAVTSGVARFVLCVGADAAALETSAAARTGVSKWDADPQFEQPYEPIIPNIYAQIACRMMHEHGITEEDFAAVAVQCQKWAVHHPHATKRKKGEITVEQVMASPMISSPLRLWNCAPWGPGGTAGAVIVASAEDAQALIKAPLYIMGAGECQTHEYLTDRMGLRASRLPLGDLPNLVNSGCRQAVRNAFGMAGMTTTDVNVLQTASQFSHTALLALAELGYTDLRNVGDFVRSGATGFGGSIPTNTNGGWLSFGQSGVSCVMDSMIEGVRQLRGEALGLQVADPEVSMIHANGGMSACHSVTILARSR